MTAWCPLWVESGH